LTHTVNFATRIQNNSNTAIDNIFVDSIRLNSSSTSPITNGLSDHDAQLLTINNIVAAVNLIRLKQRTRKINNDTIMQFQHLLKNETWESVYKHKDINNKYNSFLYTRTFINIFEASFPIKYVSIGKIKNDWITQGIKISCKCKRNLYIYSRNSNDPNARAFYIKYCKILNNVIKEAKKQHYCRLMAKSDNKIKTTRNIVKRETGKIHLAEQMPSLLINNEKVKYPVTVANAFNIFFPTISEGLKFQVRNEDPIPFLKDAFPVKFPVIKIIPTTETEIKV
jgi:hypothetical protein